MSALVRWPGLAGAILLATGQSDGLRCFPEDMRSAARSFRAAAICAPLYLAMLLLTWQQTRWPAQLPHTIAVEALTFILGWAGYAVISHGVLQWLGVTRCWPRFIIVWNWVNVVQYVLLLTAALPGAAGAPDWFSEACLLIAQGWAVWLEWYAIRLVLACSGVQAALVMAPDVVLGLVLAGLPAG